MGLRKDHRNLTAAERDRFVAALKHVKSAGVVDRLANVHARHFSMGIHSTSHFLPWHRELLLRFERELQKFHPDVTIPYWDSSVDNSTTGPLWDQGFLGQFDGAWNLGRVLGSDSLPSPQTVQDNQQKRQTYDAFWQELEVSIHNPPHRWVSGVMGQAASPGDPVFYLHHCWIDLLWAKWQSEHPFAVFVPTAAGFGLNDPLMEWPDRTPADLLNHHALGYSFDTEPVPTGPTATGDDMQPGELLGPDQSIYSADGRYQFVYQSDGNLVLYGPGGPLWASSTDGKAVGACIMQGDGNLVIYGPGALYVWDSGTDGNQGSRLIVQNDGNVVIYRPDGTAVWDTGTAVPTGTTATGDDMQPGELLGPDQSIFSADGRYQFVYQSDGNLVLYGPGGALWATGTDGQSLGVTIMQSDGNLVIYGPGATGIWASFTDGNPDSRLIVQNDGNVVIYRPDGTPVWATDTAQKLPIWESLGGGFLSGPGAVLQTGGRLVVFGRGTDNAIWHRWQVSRNGDWSDWESLGGGFTSDPDACLNAAGGLVVFGRGTDNAIWHRWQDTPDGAWSGWESLGGDFLSGPGAVLQTGGRLVVFGRGTDNAIWHRWQVSRNGDWSDWESLGGGFTSDPDACLNAAGGLVVFGRGTDNAIWHRWQDTPDGAWT